MEFIGIFLIGTAVIMGVLAFCLAILKQDAQDEGCNMPEDTTVPLPLSHMTIIFDAKGVAKIYLNADELVGFKKTTLSFWVEDRGLSTLAQETRQARHNQMIDKAILVKPKRNKK